MGQWSQQEVETLKKNMEDYLKVGQVRLHAKPQNMELNFSLPLDSSLISVL